MILIHAVEKGKNFVVNFKWDPLIYQAIHEIDGAYWLPKERQWVVPKKQKPALGRVLARFNKIDYDSNMVVGPMMVEAIDAADYVVDKVLPKPSADIEEMLKRVLKKELRHYQWDGVGYSLEKGSCLMGDQQGLGKTITSIAAIEAQNAFPCLVICKSALTKNWENEIHAWTYHKALRMTDSAKKTWPAYFRSGFCHYAICSYDSLKKYFVQHVPPAGQGTGLKGSLMVRDIVFKPEALAMFKSVIVDESHLIKDEDTFRTKVTVGLCLKRPVVYLLSGTPVLNDPAELFPQLVALGKSRFFGNREDFYKIYSKGSPNLKKALPYLNYLLHRHGYFRRLKSEVATEIPPKTRRVVKIELTNQEEYDFAEQNFKRFLEERLQKSEAQVDRALRAEALTQINYLKHLAAKGKLEAVKDWMDSMESEGEKAVVFVFHKDIQEEVYQYKREGTVRLCSSAPPDTIAKRKEQFQTIDDVKRCICSIMADAEGHTLTAASNLAMLELPWHFGKAEQCEDRIHRIGTEYPVTIDYFLGAGTIDERIYDLIMEKKDLHDMITGTDDDESDKMVDKLIFQYKN